MPVKCPAHYHIHVPERNSNLSTVLVLQRYARDRQIHKLMSVTRLRGHRSRIQVKKYSILNLFGWLWLIGFLPLVARRH